MANQIVTKIIFILILILIPKAATATEKEKIDIDDLINSGDLKMTIYYGSITSLTPTPLDKNLLIKRYSIAKIEVKSSFLHYYKNELKSLLATKLEKAKTKYQDISLY